jgi:hypothetical protein
MTKEVKERTLPFKCDILDKEPQEVKNIFGGASCTIPPDAVAVYDTIMGMQVMPNPDWEIVRKGIDWFIEHDQKPIWSCLTDRSLAIQSPSFSRGFFWTQDGRGSKSGMAIPLV